MVVLSLGLRGVGEQDADQIFPAHLGSERSTASVWCLWLWIAPSQAPFLDRIMKRAGARYEPAGGVLELHYLGSPWRNSHQRGALCTVRIREW